GPDNQNFLDVRTLGHVESASSQSGLVSARSDPPRQPRIRPDVDRAALAPTRAVRRRVRPRDRLILTPLDESGQDQALGPGLSARIPGGACVNSLPPRPRPRAVCPAFWRSIMLY